MFEADLTSIFKNMQTPALTFASCIGYVEGKGGFSCLDQITTTVVGVAIKALEDGIKVAAAVMNKVAGHLMAVQLLY